MSYTSLLEVEGMDNEKLVKDWQERIVNECVKKLGRSLTQEEKHFITSRKGFMALEAIEDTVRSSSLDEVNTYLNSEHGSNE